MARVEKMVSVFLSSPMPGKMQKQDFVNNQALTKTALFFTLLYHMSEANASYLEWNGKCFITKLLHLKRLHFYEARLSAYEAFCGIAAKYEAPQMRYEARPFQASCFFALKSRQKNGGSLSFVPLVIWMAFWGEKLRIFLWNEILKIAHFYKEKLRIHSSCWQCQSSTTPDSVEI